MLTSYRVTMRRMSVVVNIGGSVLAPSSGEEMFEIYAESLSPLEEELFVVVGGGGAAREYIKVARSLGANEAVCDKVGIDVTRLNARLLISAFGNEAYPEPPKDYQEAASSAAIDRTVVMGGVAPGQSTDAVAAVLSEYVDAERLVFATSVPGIYAKDPEVHDDANFIEEIEPSELVELVMQIELRAGSKSPVDPLAAKIIERSRLETVVVDGSEPQRVVKAVGGEEVMGTLITP